MVLLEIGLALTAVASLAGGGGTWLCYLRRKPRRAITPEMEALAEASLSVPDVPVVPIDEIVEARLIKVSTPRQEGDRTVVVRHIELATAGASIHGTDSVEVLSTRVRFQMHPHLVAYIMRVAEDRLVPRERSKVNLSMLNRVARNVLSDVKLEECYQNRVLREVSNLYYIVPNEQRLLRDLDYTNARMSDAIEARAGRGTSLFRRFTGGYPTLHTWIHGDLPSEDANC